MATKRKQYGMFKVEGRTQEVVRCGNGLQVVLIRAGKDDRLKEIEITTPNGISTVKLDAGLVVQAARVVEGIDKNKMFVCGYHGSFESRDGTAQKPTCPHCMATVIEDRHDQAQSNHAQFEEEDA